MLSITRQTWPWTQAGTTIPRRLILCLRHRCRHRGRGFGTPPPPDDPWRNPWRSAKGTGSLELFLFLIQAVRLLENVISEKAVPFERNWSQTRPKRDPISHGRGLDGLAANKPQWRWGACQTSVLRKTGKVHTTSRKIPRQSFFKLQLWTDVFSAQPERRTPMLNKVVTASAAIQWFNASAISIIVLGQVCRGVDPDRVILGGRTVKTWAPGLLTTLKRL